MAIYVHTSLFGIEQEEVTDHESISTTTKEIEQNLHNAIWPLLSRQFNTILLAEINHGFRFEKSYDDG